MIIDPCAAFTVKPSLRHSIWSRKVENARRRNSKQPLPEGGARDHGLGAFPKSIGTFLFNGPKTYQKCLFFWHGPTVPLNGIVTILRTLCLYKLLPIGSGHSPCAGNVWRIPKMGKYHTAMHLGTIRSSDYSRWDVPEKKNFLDH